MKIHVKMINFRQSVELIISSKSMHLFMIMILKCLLLNLLLGFFLHYLHFSYLHLLARPSSLRLIQ